MVNEDHPRCPEYRSKFYKLVDEYREKNETAMAKNENPDPINREFIQRIKELRQEYSFLWDE